MLRTIGRRSVQAGAWLLGAYLLALAGPAAAGDLPVGEVTAVTGTATAERPGQPPRPLRCGDPLFAGERVVTAPEGSVGFLAGEHYAQLHEGSALRLELTRDGQPDFELEAGRVRMIDPRADGAAAALAATGARARLVGTDTEAYVLPEKVARYAMFCEYDAPLEVARGEEQKGVGPGECVIAKPREPLYAARAHEERIPLTGLDACEAPQVALGPVVSRFTARDVAAPPIPSTPFPGPLAAAGILRDACDDPGSGCAGGAGLGLTTSPPEPGLPPGVGAPR